MVDVDARRIAEVGRIRPGLHLQQAVDAADEFDQLADRRIARGRRERRVLAHPLELVEDGVLRLLLPVEQEHVLEQVRQAVAPSMLAR